MQSRGQMTVMADDEVVEVLNDLIETCKDGEYGFRVCAEHCDSVELRPIFERHSAESRASALELQAVVAEHGGRPETGGTVAGAMHRGWLAVRGTVALNDDLSMLEESERGADTARDRYRRALRKDLPPSVLMVVQRQADGVQSNYDEVKRLRDQMRAASK